MGVSFKVARVGTRYKPKLLPIETKVADNVVSASDSQRGGGVEVYEYLWLRFVILVFEYCSAFFGFGLGDEIGEIRCDLRGRWMLSFASLLRLGKFSRIDAEVVGDSNKKDKNILHSTLEELEVSFSLNLFKDGFSIGKAIEFLSDIPKQLLPYDRASETLFSAIEYGWLPGEILDYIPCKYVNGALLCEIRDYRNILPYKDGHASPTGNTPIVHKMTLQLCMETIVKDILSNLNESWTYKDLLEIESCVIKALQPALHLNPEPLWDKFCGEPPRKKLDLGIAWSWKKRKLSDAPAHNSNLVNHDLDNCVTQKSKPHTDTLEESRSTSSMQEDISSRSCNPQGTNSLLDSASPSYALVILKTPTFVSEPNQLFTNVSNTAPRNPIFPSEKGTCDKEAIRGLPLKKPKLEPVELPKFHLSASQANIAPLDPELQRMDNALQDQLKVDKILSENKRRKLNSSQSAIDDQVVLKGIQNQLTRAPSVKQEPVETSGLNTDYLCMDNRINPSNLHNSKQQFFSKPLIINSSSFHTLNQMPQPQPSDKYLKNGTSAQKRKNSQNSQVIATEGSLSTTSRNSNSFQRRTPISTGQKNSCSKCLKTEMVNSVVGMSGMNVTTAQIPTVKNLSMPQPSVEVNIAVDRLLKIQSVSERYGLVNRKHKLDHFVGKKPFFCQTPPLVGFHLASFEDSGKSEDFARYKISPSQYSNYWKTRTLIFSHESHILPRSDNPMIDREAQVKLVMLENLHLGTVEAWVYYGCGENPISFPLLPTFPSTSNWILIGGGILFLITVPSIPNIFGFEKSDSVFIFGTAAFCQPMAREGYLIISDQVGCLPCTKDGESDMEKQPIVRNAIVTSGTVQPSATRAAGPSSPLLQNSLSTKMPFHDSSQLLPQNVLSGVHFATSGISRSSPQPTHGCSSKPQVDNLQRQMRSAQQWLQQDSNKFSSLQYQMQLLRHWKEQELLQKTESRVNLAASASAQNTVPPFNGLQRIRNIEPGSHNNITGNNGSLPISSGGLLHWLNSLSTSNNLEINCIPGLNDKQHFSALSDHRLAASPKLNTTQDLQTRGLICGLPPQRNASMLSVTRPDACDMRNMFIGHQVLQAGTSQQSFMHQQQEIRSMLWPQKAAAASNLTDHVASPLPLVSSLHHQMNHGSISGGSGSPEVNSWTHGSHHHHESKRKKMKTTSLNPLLNQAGR
ncbi:Spt20 domain-containing protein [Senna tora]|uniref:Spt20 domain-containing protein n=1 Tax=Senna tora TaxID=362788 RepID=A0A834WRS1_9FABA|nr:Spt20 domain-containing protein [Senna tora]